MTTERSYRETLTIYDALVELKANAGTQFCPAAVKAFVSGFAASNQELVREAAAQAVREAAMDPAEARQAREYIKLAKKEAKARAKQEAEAAKLILQVFRQLPFHGCMTPGIW